MCYYICLMSDLDAPVMAELAATANAFRECGFSLPPGLAPPDLLAGVGFPYLPNEFPPAEFLSTMGPEARHYFSHVVQPDLLQALQEPKAKSLRLGHQIGRLIGANGSAGPLFSPQPPMEIRPEAIAVDGHVIPYEIKTGRVIEYGMGVNGLFAHLQALKRRQHNVYGIQKTAAETAVLRGVADYHHLDRDRLVIADRGIAYRVQQLVRSARTQGLADIVVASRAHGAGEELLFGIAKAAQLLRVGGLLVARGPSQHILGSGYDAISHQISEDSGLRILLDHPYDLASSNGVPDPNRLVVAEKVSG
jgi:hypothetical protein